MSTNYWLPSQLPRTFAACERDVTSEKADVRASAVSDLVAHTRDPSTRTRSLELLAAALEDPEARVRARAAIALADGDGGHVHTDALITAVGDADDEVRQLAITALGEIGDERAIPRLLRAAEDERASMRYQAVIALARLEIDDELRTKVLLRATSDDDFNIRYIAMRLAEEHFAPDETKPAPERLRLRAVAMLDDDERDVTVAAAIFLGHAGDERGKPLLRRVVRAEIPAQREDEREAVELVGALGMRDLMPDLEKRAFGIARHVRDTCSFHALIALARMGHEGAIARIRRDLASKNEKRREAAAIAASRAHLDG
jgi:HEAT repeat protein